jgi:hypothetical protein
VQRGKDLSRVRTVIGTGGVLVAEPRPGAACCGPRSPTRASRSSAAPAAPRLLLDRDYLLYACGLLAGRGAAGGARAGH